MWPRGETPTDPSGPSPRGRTVKGLSRDEFMTGTDHLIPICSRSQSSTSRPGEWRRPRIPRPPPSLRALAPQGTTEKNHACARRSNARIGRALESGAVRPTRDVLTYPALVAFHGGPGLGRPHDGD